MVPEGWQKTPFGEVIRIANGQVDPKISPYAEMPHIGPENIESGSGKLSGVKTASECGLISGKYEFDEHAIVYSKIRPNLNKVAKPQYAGICSADMYPIWGCEGISDTDFIFQLMLSDRFVAATTAVSLRTGMPKINRPDLTAIPILLPPLAEQKRIAEVLGVWDRAIAVAGQQLDLARTQKRALMQTLLTPTRRFPGFDGQPWKEVRLGDVGLISSAGVDKKTNPAEPEVRLLNFLDVFRRDFLYDKEFDHVVTAPAAKLEQCNVQKGDVFFTPSSETRDDLARSAVAMEDMPGVVYSYHVVRLRLTEDWDMNFRAFVFQSDRFQRQAYEKGDGSGQRYVISQSNFRDMTVFVPGKEEQALIGATLKAAADEITALETQITRLQAEKKALMQQLLTGKKRILK